MVVVIQLPVGVTIANEDEEVSWEIDDDEWFLEVVRNLPNEPQQFHLQGQHDQRAHGRGGIGNAIETARGQKRLSGLHRDDLGSPIAPPDPEEGHPTTGLAKKLAEEYMSAAVETDRLVDAMARSDAARVKAGNHVDFEWENRRLMRDGFGNLERFPIIQEREAWFRSTPEGQRADLIFEEASEKYDKAIKRHQSSINRYHEAQDRMDNLAVVQRQRLMTHPTSFEHNVVVFPAGLLMKEHIGSPRGAELVKGDVAKIISRSNQIVGTIDGMTHPDRRPGIAVEIDVDRDVGRSYYTPGKNTIHLNANGRLDPDGRPEWNDHTIAHEYGHHVETSNFEIQNRRREFIESRTVNKAQPLGGDYNKDELYRDDNFTSRYVSKTYSDPRSSEVVSMGIQQLHDNPGRFAASDPDYFNFTYNTLNKIPDRYDPQPIVISLRGQ